DGSTTTTINHPTAPSVTEPRQAAYPRQHDQRAWELHLDLSAASPPSGHLAQTPGDGASSSAPACDGHQPNAARTVSSWVIRRPLWAPAIGRRWASSVSQMSGSCSV